MKFSVLIANYNNGKFFKECYDSILAQEYKNWEAVILDDASTDNSVEVIKKIIGNDERFKFFANAENSGVGITKSKLIDLATGNICGFVDPDDAITPNALSSSIKVFENKKDVVLTYTKFFKCDENLKPLEVSKMADQVVNNNPYFFNCPVNIVHFVSFRKCVYDTTEKMNTVMKIAEDQDLYLKMYEKGKVQFINEVNYFYRLHSGGISQNDNKLKSREYFAKVIFNTMKRRNLTSINGKKIPEVYTNSQDIYGLLEYQNSISFKIKKKLTIFAQQIFS
ncbi:Glycosyltransferase involved in cell wall bisynthesis [Chryseobacterium arachidis]|uniref:Glycosyltransferase involved in cell wall bisynthesis n=1 Tax=Chryseobacterium arachidis TaxID=1416778 RepID=A0A1M4XHF2_9FLAO|nr:glycosyltransferase [Chryseobacterium arachidis]SHE92831.1 Glycosyltransferase involved in cell wall bisynthesis [Chryseobacterium arachidis]